MPAKAVNQAQGEGRDALAFVFAGLVAAVVLLPARALLDLKLAALGLAAAVLCVGLAWKGRAAAWESKALWAWQEATVALAVYALGLQGLQRASGSFGNASYYAAFLVLSWPLALTQRGFQRSLGLILALAALLATGSRAGALALAVQGAILAWRVPAWRGRLALAGGALLAAALLFWGRDGLLRPTLRLELWRQTFALAMQKPWLGWGWQPFVALTDGLWQGSLAASSAYPEDPHQLLLSAFFHFGVLGLALSVGAGAWLLRWLWRQQDGAGQAMALGFSGLLVQAQADRYFLQAGALGLLLLALALRVQVPARIRGAFAALALWLLIASLRPVLAWRSAVRAPADLPPPSAKLAAGPRDPAHWDQMGTQLASKGVFHEAEGAFRQAFALQPSAARAINLGNTQMMQARYPDAEASFRQAVALDAKNADARFSLGYALFEQRKIKDALASLDEALRLDPSHAEAAKLKEQILH